MAVVRSLPVPGLDEGAQDRAFVPMELGLALFLRMMRTIAARRAVMMASIRRTAGQGAGDRRVGVHADMRRRSRSPRAPVTRARTLPSPAGSISGTAEEGAYSTT